MRLSDLSRRLPADFEIVLADIGSAGGLHKRWRPVREHVAAVLFDPLDQSTGRGRDRYIPVAVAGEKGRAVLHVTRRVSMTSALVPNAPLLKRFWDKSEHTEIERSFEVPTDTLDNIAAAHRLVLDALKIDVQGGEYDILTGARAALKSVILAEIECSFLERYVGIRTLDAVVALMRENGFDLIDVSRLKRYRYRNSFGVINPGLGHGDRAGRLAFCDAIFLPSEERLLQRLALEGGRFAEKAIMALLVYGKADIAAFLVDAAGETLDPDYRKAATRLLGGLKGRRRFDRSGLHRALDYLARRV
jgi:FkbM family methyltransferase